MSAGNLVSLAMQILKEEIRNRIMTVAREQFLEKNYLKASMRDIALASGVGVGNIYNYFTNKDELLRAVVHPVTSEIERMLDRHHGHYGSDALEMPPETYFRMVMDGCLALVKEQRALMTILIFRAQGSSLENFREQFSDRATVLVKEWFARNKAYRPEINVPVSDFFIHLHTVWMFSLFEEMLMHDVPASQMEQIVSEYVRFEIQDWKYLI